MVAEALSAEHLPEQVRVRRAKLDRLREQGVDPYPVGFPRTHTLAQVRAEAGATSPPDTATGGRVSVAGRVMLKRDMGKLGFATLRDGSGDLQVMVDVADVGAEGVRVLEALRRPRRPRRRDRRGDHHPAAASSPSAPSPSS